jgi:hypothetical protein
MLRGSSWSTALALLLTVWASPASPICTSKDWFASFSSCVANQRSVTYQWRLPKNCGDVGNLPPSGRTVPRGDHFCPCSLSQHGRCFGVQSCQCVVDDFYYEYTACLNGTRTKRFRKLESRSSSVRAIA